MLFTLAACGGGGGGSGGESEAPIDPNGTFSKPYITFADSTNAGEITVEWLPAKHSGTIASDTEYRIEASLAEDFSSIDAQALLSDSQVTLKQLETDRIWYLRISATKENQTLISRSVRVEVSGNVITLSNNNVINTDSSQIDLTPNDENVIALPDGTGFVQNDILVDEDTGLAVRINQVNGNEAEISHVGLGDIYKDLDFKTSFTLADTAEPDPSFNKSSGNTRRNKRIVKSSSQSVNRGASFNKSTTGEDRWKSKSQSYFDGLAYRKLGVRYKTHEVIKTGTDAPVLDLVEVTDYFEEHAVWIKKVEITHPTLGSIDCEVCKSELNINHSDKLNIFPWRQNTWRDDFYGGSWLSDRPYTVKMTIATCDTKDNENCVADENHIEEKFDVKTKLYIISAAEENNFKFPTIDVDATFYIDKNKKFQINGFGKLGQLVDFAQDANALRNRIKAIIEENKDANRKGKKIVTVRDGLQGLENLLQREIDSVDETQQLQDQNLLTFLASKELDSISEKEMQTLDKVVKRYQGKGSVQEALKEIVTPVKEIDCSTDTENCKAFLRIAGSLTLDPTVDVGFKMKSGTEGEDFSVSNIESTHFALHASPEDFNLRVEAEIGANAHIELGKDGFPAYEIASKRFYRVVFAGPVPIIISGRISMMGEIDLEATFSAQASLKEEYTYEAEFAAGMSYGKPLQDLISFTCTGNNNDKAPLGNTKFYMVGCYNTTDSDFVTTAKINGKASGTARFKIYPEVEFMVYRNIGVIGSVEPQVYATAEVEGNVVDELIIDDGAELNLTADYQFNRMEVGLAAQTRFRADLGLIYTDHKAPKAKEKVAGLSYPGCGKFICDRNQRKALPDKNVEDPDYPLSWALFSLPSAAISDNNGYLGLHNHLSLNVTSTPGEKFGHKGGNAIEEYNWLAYQGNERLDNIEFKTVTDKNDNVWVQVANPLDLEPGAYNFRLIYSSVLGSFVRQRKDFFFNYNPPTANTNLQVRAFGNAVGLSWDQTHDPETGEYLIYRDDVHIASVSTTNYIDNEADPSQSYRYQVRPASGQSIQFNADEVLYDSSKVPPLEPPTLNIEATHQQFTAQWEPVENAEFYELCYSNESLASLDNIDDCSTYRGGTVISPITELEHTVKGLSSNGNYFIRMVSANSTTRSPLSAEATAETRFVDTIFSNRIGHHAATLNGKMVVVGGRDFTSSHLLNDVWSSANGTSWLQETKNAAFVSREYHQLVKFNNQLLLIGGKDSSGTSRNDVWMTENGKDWQLLTEEAEFSPRHKHIAIVFNERLFVIGGDGSNGRTNDIWSSGDGINWQLENSSALFSARSDHQVTQLGNKLYLIGGYDRDELNDIWSSTNGVDWQLENQSAPFTGRADHQVVSFNGNMLLIGGYHRAGNNDIWSSSDGINWSLKSANADFSPRFGHRVVVHNNKLNLIGGFESEFKVYKNDIWESENGIQWVKIAGNADFSPRFNHQATAFNGHQYVMGGFATRVNSSSVRSAEAWSSSNGLDWTVRQKVIAAGDRTGHQLVKLNNKLYLIGGRISSTQLENDVWVSDDGDDWTLLTSDAGFAPRENHTAIAFNNKIYVIAGNSGRVLNDVWSTPDGINWTLETESAEFSVRIDHQVVATSDAMYLIGGGWNEDPRNDVWRSTDGITWTLLTNNAPFSGREGHQTVIFKNKIYVLGGYVKYDDLRGDVWSSVDGFHWQEETSVAFTPRYQHQALATDNAIYVLGGRLLDDPFLNSQTTSSDVWMSTDGKQWQRLNRSNVLNE